MHVKYWKDINPRQLKMKAEGIDRHWQTQQYRSNNGPLGIKK